jgi:hypothetical protein
MASAAASQGTAGRGRRPHGRPVASEVASGRPWGGRGTRAAAADLAPRMRTHHWCDRGRALSSHCARHPPAGATASRAPPRQGSPGQQPRHSGSADAGKRPRAHTSQHLAPVGRCSSARPPRAARAPAAGPPCSSGRAPAPPLRLRASAGSGAGAGAGTRSSHGARGRRGGAGAAADGHRVRAALCRLCPEGAQEAPEHSHVQGGAAAGLAAPQVRGGGSRSARGAVRLR